jgi:hypothetical protein
MPSLLLIHSVSITVDEYSMQWLGSRKLGAVSHVRNFAYHCLFCDGWYRFSAVQKIKSMFLRCTHTVKMIVSDMFRGCLRFLRPYSCISGRVHLHVPTVDHNSGCFQLFTQNGEGRLRLSNWQVYMTRRVRETMSLLDCIFVYGIALWPRTGLSSSDVCS